MAVLTELSDNWGKPAPTMFTLHVAPEPGGAVTGTVLQLAGRRPEPTQRGCSGGQVDTLTSNGDQQFGETEALTLYEGLGGETVARVTTIFRHSCPSPPWSCGRMTTGPPTHRGRSRQELRTYSTASSARPCGSDVTNYSCKQMAFITNLKEGDVSLA